MCNKTIVSFLLCGLLLWMPIGVVQAAEMQVQEKMENGDGFEITESYETKRSKQTPCCLTVEMICPEDFGLSTYVMLIDDVGKIYRVSAGAEQGYTESVYLAPGHYEIIEASVYEDFKQQYPFEIGEKELTLDPDVNQTLTCVMRTEQTEGAERTDMTEENRFPTGLDTVTMKEDGTLSYQVSHKGNGAGTVEASGFATGDYEVVVRIAKTGVVGEAEYEISLDGGENYIGRDVVAENCRIVDAGLTLYFKNSRDSDEFIQGDVYSFHAPEAFSVTASKNCEANLVVSGHPMKDHEYLVRILSSGGSGISRFTVESGNGKETGVTAVIPENGRYDLEDGLTLYFSNSSAFEKGMEYTVTVKSNDREKNYVPLYFLLAAAVVGSVTAVTVLGSRKEKESSYRLQSYRWRKDEKEYGE